MSGSTPTNSADSETTRPPELEALGKEYRAYIDELRMAWLRDNRSQSQNVYEVMRSAERQEVHRIMADWGRYVTPLAESWWKERGYGVKWPDDNSQPMEIYRLEES